jgi:hypothetical protein
VFFSVVDNILTGSKIRLLDHMAFMWQGCILLTRNMLAYMLTDVGFCCDAAVGANGSGKSNFFHGTLHFLICIVAVNSVSVLSLLRCLPPEISWLQVSNAIWPSPQVSVLASRERTLELWK